MRPQVLEMGLATPAELDELDAGVGPDVVDQAADPPVGGAGNGGTGQ